MRESTFTPCRDTSVETYGHGLYMPAMWPFGLNAAVRCWVRAWRRRRAAVNLLKLSDRTLEDIGYSRRELQATARQPLRLHAARAGNAARRAHAGE